MSAEKISLSGKTTETATEKYDVTVERNDASTDFNVKATRSLVVRRDGNNSPDGPVTVSTAIYAAGDHLTDGFIVPNVFRKNGGTAILQSAMILDSCGQNAAMDLFFFAVGSTSSVDSITSLDNQAVVISASQFGAGVAGCWQIATSDYRTFSTGKTVATPQSQPPLVLQGDSATFLFCIPVARSTPTFSSTNALTFVFGFLQD